AARLRSRRSRRCRCTRPRRTRGPRGPRSPRSTMCTLHASPRILNARAAAARERSLNLLEGDGGIEEVAVVARQERALQAEAAQLEERVAHAREAGVALDALAGPRDGEELVPRDAFAGRGEAALDEEGEREAQRAAAREVDARAVRGEPARVARD